MAGGTILWKPVDRIAARMIQKAPWWAHPPHEIKQEKIKTQKHTMKAKTLITENPMATSGQQFMTHKSEEEMHVEIARAAIKCAEKTITSSEKLVEQAMDARAALDAMANTYKASWFEFAEGCDERLKTLRMNRMAMDSEMRQLMASLREVRQFFLDSNHEREIERLKEFVSVCERLQSLKASGFLDSVADTMLKLSNA